jgi:hypothetical protein
MKPPFGLATRSLIQRCGAEFFTVCGWQQILNDSERAG